MKPPIPYFGGKGRLAPWIVSLMPPHRVYVEPFAGSAAVLLAKPPTTLEVLNDIDGHLVRFFRVLRDQPEELERACSLTPYARDEFNACADLEGEAGTTDVELARRWWARSSQSFASTGTGSHGWSTSVVARANNARSATNRVYRFAGIAERLREVVIDNRDVFDVLERYAAPDGVAYLDPPYLDITRTTFTPGAPKRPSGDYAHEFATADEHRALAEVARAWPGTVLLSGYASELYDRELYPDWSRVEQRVLRRTSNGRGGANTHVVEVLWSNRPIQRQGDLFA